MSTIGTSDLTLHERCLQGVVAECKALHLDGIDPRVYPQTLPDEKSLVFPCVVCTIEGEQEEEGDSGFEDDAVILPVRVLLCDRSDTDYQARRKVYLAWRRQLLRHFRSLTTLPDVEECCDVRVRSQVIVDPQLPQYQYLVSGFVVLCHTWEMKESVEAEED